MKPWPKLTKKPPRGRQRAQDGAQHARAHHAAVQWCEAKSHGIASPCGVGMDATLQHSHTIGKGMGGGQDYAVSDGECSILCGSHHTEIDTRRVEMRAAGLSKRAPRPSKVVPRPSEA